MPFTPFHFGPSACVALPLKKRLDLPVFVLVSVAVDLEPLCVMVSGLSYPLHGYAHTLLGSALVGLLFGWVAYALRTPVVLVMNKLRLRYNPDLRKALWSGVVGAWFHVLLDSMLYQDIRPFYPFVFNPFLGLVSFPAMYLACALAFIPALVLYIYYAAQYPKR